MLFIIYLIFQLLTILVAYNLDDEESLIRMKSTNKQNLSMANTVRSISSNKSLITFIFCIAFIEAAHTPLFVFYQNFLQSKEFQGEFISITISVAMLSGSFAHYFARYFKKVSIYRLTEITIIICFTILFFHFIRVPLLVLIPMFIFFNAIPHILFIYTDSYINSQFDNENRATSLSMVSFINSILIAVSYIGLGLISDLYGVEFALVIPMTLLLFSFLLLRTNKGVFS